VLSRKAYKRWFIAASLYNAVWGSWVTLFPEAYFRMIDMIPPKPIAIWQCVGMMVLVYGLAYYLVSAQPERYGAFIWVGLAGKVFGPLGFLYATITHELPARFGWILIPNDLIWWPVFASFCISYARNPFAPMAPVEKSEAAPIR
jgi:small multidrug resistance pump